MAPAAIPETARGGDGHLSVLLDEVLAALAPRDGDALVDATFGAGGYSRAMLESARCNVWAIDRDPEAEKRADAFAETLEADERGRFRFLAGRFSEMEKLLAGARVAAVDGIVFDLGVSSMQFETADRGFSFREEGPLDMRMTPGGEGPAAADLVNSLDEAELSDIFRRYGEEPKARAIARAVVRARREAPIRTTTALARIVGSAASDGRRRDRNPATRVFQALRIAVNRELDELALGLAAAERLLKSGGRLAAVSFHSLEDRIVKDFIRDRSGRTARPSRHLPESVTAGRAPTFVDILPGGTRPSAEEIARNPRARSARLRAARRTAAPVPDRAATGGSSRSGEPR